MENKSAKSSPRHRYSVSTKTSARESATCSIDSSSFRPILVTNCGGYTLAYMSSASRENYLALWNVECQSGITTELSVDNSQFCKNLCSGSIIGLSLRTQIHYGIPRFIVHATCSDTIERWVLGETGNIMEYQSKNLATPIEHFLVNVTGDVMASFEDKFIVLRHRDLKAFNIFRCGKEIPCNAVFITNADKQYLIACYESSLVAGWVITDSDSDNRPHVPLFSVKLSSSSALCSIVEIMNTERLFHRRLCAASKEGQIFLLEWSMKDLSVCHEVRVVDLRKHMRIKSSGQSQTAAPATMGAGSSPTNKLAGRRRSMVDQGFGNAAAAAISGLNIDGDEGVVKRVNPTINVASICPSPDVAYNSNYSPPGCNGEYDGLSITESAPFKISVMIGLTNGSVLCLDIESFSVISSQTTDSIEQTVGAKALIITNGHPIVSSALTSSSAIEQPDERGILEKLEDEADNTSDEESDEEGTPRDRNESSVSSRPASWQRKVSAISARKTSNMSGSAGTLRRTAERKRREQLAQQQKPNADDFALASIGVFLGSFDRRIVVCRTYLPRITTRKEPENKEKEESSAARNVKKDSVKFGETKLRPSKSVVNARLEVERLPKWALKNDESSDSLISRTNQGNNSEVLSDAETDFMGATIGASRNGISGEEDLDTPLSFFTSSRGPFSDSSPLRSLSNITKLGKKPDSRGGGGNNAGKSSQGRVSGARGDWEMPGKTKKGQLVDLPVTFHCRVKSSGYGKPDVSSNRWKQTRQPGGPQRSKSAPRSTRNTDRTTVQSRLRMYPRDCGLLTMHQPYNDYPPKVSNIPLVPHMSAKFSSDGALLGLVSSGNSVVTLKTPISRYKGEGLCYLGHDAQITDMGFAHKENMLITSSVDGTARIWKMGKVDSSAVEISHIYHNPKLGGTSASKKPTGSRSMPPTTRNKPFGSTITGASFFYMDQFALLSVKSSVLMYTFDLEEFETTNDLKRLHANGKYKLAHEWNCSPAQSVTAFSCLNSVESPIIIAATSDRCLNVLDALTGRISRNISGAHERNISCIALPQPSVHVPLPQSAYNVFATSAPDNVIMMWDVRSPSCVGRYTDHVNRREKIQCSLSPCMRYIATGSEDRTARIFDIVSGREMCKLSGMHRDVVSSAAFHPIHPQLVTSSYDGTLRSFTCDEE